MNRPTPGADAHNVHGHSCCVRCQGRFHVDTFFEPKGFLENHQLALIEQYAPHYFKHGGLQVLAVHAAGWLGSDPLTDGVAVIFAAPD
jgi:hypothetical protein